MYLPAKEVLKTQVLNFPYFGFAGHNRMFPWSYIRQKSHSQLNCSTWLGYSFPPSTINLKGDFLVILVWFTDRKMRLIKWHSMLSDLSGEGAYLS